MSASITTYIELSRMARDWGLSFEQNVDEAQKIREADKLKGFSVIDRGTLIRCAEALESLVDAAWRTHGGVYHLVKMAQLHANAIVNANANANARDPVADGFIAWLSPAAPAVQAAVQDAVPITDLNLGARARKVMRRMSIKTIGELCARTADELIENKGFGWSSLQEVTEKLEARGLSLRVVTPGDQP